MTVPAATIFDLLRARPQGLGEAPPAPSRPAWLPEGWVVDDTWTVATAEDAASQAIIVEGDVPGTWETLYQPPVGAIGYNVRFVDTGEIDTVYVHPDGTVRAMGEFSPGVRAYTDEAGAAPSAGGGTGLWLGLVSLGLALAGGLAIAATGD